MRDKQSDEVLKDIEAHVEPSWRSFLHKLFEGIDARMCWLEKQVNRMGDSAIEWMKSSKEWEAAADEWLELVNRLEDKIAQQQTENKVVADRYTKLWEEYQQLNMTSALLFGGFSGAKEFLAKLEEKDGQILALKGQLKQKEEIIKLKNSALSKVYQSLKGMKTGWAMFQDLMADENVVRSLHKTLVDNTGKEGDCGGCD